mmetsp:Transcript_25554/g.46518  ORF Transcript_25554/g.46518 Transcript_25554/m.46518 type:complete len:95 (-) Transcript_25554:17-301(-)
MPNGGGLVLQGTKLELRRPKRGELDLLPGDICDSWTPIPESGQSAAAPGAQSAELRADVPSTERGGVLDGGEVALLAEHEELHELKSCALVTDH